MEYSNGQKPIYRETVTPMGLVYIPTTTRTQTIEMLKNTKELKVVGTCQWQQLFTYESEKIKKVATMNLWVLKENRRKVWIVEEFRAFKKKKRKRRKMKGISYAPNHL